jgi:hypothetical protein
LGSRLPDPVARQIEGKYPLAATLLRRAMIDDTLEGAKSSRYKHAARHLLECQSLAMMIRDYGPFETDEAFTSRLRASHDRETGFWKQVAEVSGTQSRLTLAILHSSASPLSTFPDPHFT